MSSLRDVLAGLRPSDRVLACELLDAVGPVPEARYEIADALWAQAVARRFAPAGGAAPQWEPYWLAQLTEALACS